MFAGNPAQKLLAAFYASQKIPDAWDAWRSYRGQVTEDIVENSIPGTSLAIFGAGRLNDLSLPKLLGHFAKVALFDKEEDAMQEALRRDAKELLCKKNSPCKKAQISPALNLFPVDFVGIPDEDYIAFANALLQIGESLCFYGIAEAGKETEKPPRHDRENAAAFSRMCKKAEDVLAGMYEKSRAYVPELPKEKYDYTVALGVHSQLGNVPAWLLDAVEAYLQTYLQTGQNFRGGDEKGMRGSFLGQGWQEIKEKLLVRIEQESAYFSGRFNEIILSATKTKAFIGCEISRAVCEDGIWYAVPDSYVSGAWQAVEDVKRRAARGDICFENYLDIIWPFSPEEGRAYRMMVMEAEVK